MPDMTEIATDSGEPASIPGGSSFAPVEIERAATEAILDPDGMGFRAPSSNEGGLLWEMANDIPALDLNSPYAYLMQCRNFQNTCAVAESYGRPAGFVTAHCRPNRPDILFVWQIAVLPAFRGMGIATRLLDHVLARDANADVSTVEATVTPSNTASRALFAAFAKEKGATLKVRTGFERDAFPDGHGHEPEDLLVINPIAA